MEFRVFISEKDEHMAVMVVDDVALVERAGFEEVDLEEALSRVVEYALGDLLDLLRPMDRRVSLFVHRGYPKRAVIWVTEREDVDYGGGEP